MMFKRQQCSVCGHSKRQAIDAELAEGIATREIASKFGLSKSAVQRHAMLHVVDVDDGSGDHAIKSLLVSAQKALRRAESRGDHKAVLEALRLLAELRKRNRIQSAASASTEHPYKEKRDEKWLVEELKRIYGLKGANWDARLAQREADARKTPDETLVELLGLFVERCSDATTAAIATRLASRILNEPLDSSTERVVTRLEQSEDQHGDSGNNAGMVFDEEEREES